MTRRASAAAIAMLSLGVAAELRAQPRTPPRPEPPAFALRVFGEAGIDSFAASRSFNAIFGSDSGTIFGGGADVVWGSNWFVRVGGWRFKKDGERAVRVENQTFRLGIPLTVTILPIEVTAGYRFPVGRRKLLIPYVAGGVSSYSYKEVSDFAEADENVNERFTGYQALGGIEYRLHRLVGVAGEIQYTTVPDALGAGGLSAEFNENDLGGIVVRARVLFGR